LRQKESFSAKFLILNPYCLFLELYPVGVT